MVDNLRNHMKLDRLVEEGEEPLDFARVQPHPVRHLHKEQQHHESHSHSRRFRRHVHLEPKEQQNHVHHVVGNHRGGVRLLVAAKEQVQWAGHVAMASNHDHHGADHGRDQLHSCLYGLGQSRQVHLRFFVVLHRRLEVVRHQKVLA